MLNYLSKLGRVAHDVISTNIAKDSEGGTTVVTSPVVFFCAATVPQADLEIPTGRKLKTGFLLIQPSNLPTVRSAEHQHERTARKLLREAYEGRLPFLIWTWRYFRQHLE